MHCCEVHQFIWWDVDFHVWNEGPPHEGFRSSMGLGDPLPPLEWYRDRDAAGTRYGHRDQPGIPLIDWYTDADLTHKQALGLQYHGADQPQTQPGAKGIWKFKLKLYDRCLGEYTGYESPVITLNWGAFTAGD